MGLEMSKILNKTQENQGMKFTYLIVWITVHCKDS